MSDKRLEIFICVSAAVALGLQCLAKVPQHWWQWINEYAPLLGACTVVGLVLSHYALRLFGPILPESNETWAERAERKRRARQ